MSAGKINYAYRLTVARLVIVRLRFRRYQQKFFSADQSLLHRIFHSRITLFLSFMVVLAGLLLAWLAGSQSSYGTQASHRQSASVAELVDAEIASLHAEKDEVISDLKAERKSLKDKVDELMHSLSYQRIENSSLKAQVKVQISEIIGLQEAFNEQAITLEQLRLKSIGLEKQMLEEDRLFRKERSSWLAANTERKVVYNITNIPVGGHVTEGQAPGVEDVPGVEVLGASGNLHLAVEADNASQQENHSPDVVLRNSYPPEILPAGNSAESGDKAPGTQLERYQYRDSGGRQQSNFGPAVDHYEDLILPGMPTPLP